MEFGDYTDGGIGAIIGSIITILSFGYRLKSIEDRHAEFRQETRDMHREIRDDIKNLVDKTTERRCGD